jgi:hypothetical protein
MSTRIRKRSIKSENNDDVEKHENVNENDKDKENKKSQKINQIINKFLPVVNYYYLTKTETKTETETETTVDVDSLLNKNKENNSHSSNVNVNDFQIRKQKKKNKIKKKTTAEVNNNNNNKKEEEEEEEIQKLNIDIELEEGEEETEEKKEEQEEGKNFKFNHQTSRKFLNYYCFLKNQNQLAEVKGEEDENLHLLIEEAAACLNPKTILGSGFRIFNNTTLASTSTKINTKFTKTHYKHLWDAILLHKSNTNSTKLKTLNNAPSNNLNPQQLLPTMTSHHSSNIAATFPNTTRTRTNEAKFNFFQNNPNTNAASFLLSPADQQKKRFDLNRLILKNRIYSSLNANSNFNSNIKSKRKVLIFFKSHLRNLIFFF